MIRSRTRTRRVDARRWLGRGVAVLTLALGLSAPSSAVQILRPQQESADAAILETERVARLVLQLPVEREVAYEAWTDANQLVQWLPQWAEMTVTEGGTFEMGWEGVEAAWGGTYLEVERPERLAFTWLPPEEVFPSGAYETVVTLTFDETDAGGTTMTLEHSGFRGIDELEAQLQAWRAYLFALRAFVLQPPAGTPPAR